MGVAAALFPCIISASSVCAVAMTTNQYEHYPLIRGSQASASGPQRLSETGWSWGDGPGAGVPASAGVWPDPADAGTPGARSGGAGHPACRGTDAHQLFRQSLSAFPG